MNADAIRCFLGARSEFSARRCEITVSPTPNARQAGGKECGKPAKECLIFGQCIEPRVAKMIPKPYSSHDGNTSPNGEGQHKSPNYQYKKRSAHVCPVPSECEGMMARWRERPANVALVALRAHRLGSLHAVPQVIRRAAGHRDGRSLVLAHRRDSSHEARPTRRRRPACPWPSRQLRPVR
jgi:hypothetical protein